MKNQFTIFKLILRMSFWKVLLILIAMAVSQIILFFAMGALQEAYLLDAMERIPFSVVVVIGLGLLSAALGIPLSDRGGRMNNLILRLGVSEKKIYWLHVLFNALAYWLFVIVQGLVMVLLCYVHDWLTPGEMDPMAVFVTSYQYPLFHRFFPLHDVAEWINHLMLVAGLSISTAAYPMRQRHRFNSVSTTVMVAFAFNYYTSWDRGDYLDISKIILPFIVTVVVIVICLYGVLSMEVDDDGKT